jgi:hypothetical protein
LLVQTSTDECDLGVGDALVEGRMQSRQGRPNGVRRAIGCYGCRSVSIYSLASVLEGRRADAGSHRTSEGRSERGNADRLHGLEEEGDVPSRLLKTDAGDGRQKGTPWWMFALGEETQIAVTPDELAREGARRMIAAAPEAEVGKYVERFADELDQDGRRLAVRNGRARERKVSVGVGHRGDPGTARDRKARRSRHTGALALRLPAGRRPRPGPASAPDPAHLHASLSPKVDDVCQCVSAPSVEGGFRPALE